MSLSKKLIFFSLCLLFSFNSFSQQTDKNLDKALVNRFGPVNWAQCVAGQITIGSLVARGDKINPEIIKANESLGKILYDMRQYMLSNGYDQSQLNELMKIEAQGIRSGDDALKVVSKCIRTINAVMKW